MHAATEHALLVRATEHRSSLGLTQETTQEGLCCMPHTMRAALASAQQRPRKQRRKEGAHPFLSTVCGAAQEKHRLFGFHATDHPVKASDRKGNQAENVLFCFGCEAKKNRHQHSDPPKNARKNAANPKKSISFPLFLRTKNAQSRRRVFLSRFPKQGNQAAHGVARQKTGDCVLFHTDHRCLHHKPTQDEKRAFPKPNDLRECTTGFCAALAKTQKPDRDQKQSEIVER